MENANKLFILLTFNICYFIKPTNSNSNKSLSNLSNISIKSPVLSPRVNSQDSINVINSNVNNATSFDLSSVTTPLESEDLAQTIITVFSNKNKLNSKEDDQENISINDVVLDLNSLKYKWVADYKDKETKKFNKQKFLESIKQKDLRHRSRLVKNKKAMFLERLNQAEEKEDIIEILKTVLETILHHNNNTQNKVSQSTLVNVGGTMVGIGLIIALNWVLNNWGKVS